MPPVPGLKEAGYLTYKESLDLDQLPTRMVVIGGGAIGLEIGQMYARFGTHVVILEALSVIAGTEEPEISEALKECLMEEGIEIYTSARLQRAEKTAERKMVGAVIEGRPKIFRAEEILVATGLRPNTEELGLEKIGVKCDAQGAVVVDNELRTSVRHIWAAGDVTGQMMLVTVAAYQGGLAAENALVGSHDKMRLEAVPHAIFTSPGVASVGLKEQTAQASRKEVITRVLTFDQVPEAAAIRDTRGIIKMVVDAKDYTIIGVHILGAEAPDLIHLGVLAVRNKMTVGDLIRTIFVYPTMAEAFKIAALSFRKDVTKLSCCAA